MGKKVFDVVLDAALQKVATGNQITVCSAEPTTLLEATTTFRLVEVTVTPGDGNGDYVIANGDLSGRKVSVQQQSLISILADGTANHVAINGGTTILDVTTCTDLALTSGGVVTIPSFDHEIQDAT